MKRFMRPLLSLLLVTGLLFSPSLAASAAEDFDFDREIAAFTPDPFNTHELSVGEAHSPQAALWAKDGTCLTSDASVVTVSQDGTVRAVSEGRAYVAIVAVTGMFRVYRYDVVQAPVSTESQPPQDTETTDDPTSLLPPSEPEQSDGDDPVILPGVIRPDTDQDEDDKEDDPPANFAWIAFVLVGFVILLLAYALISALRLSASSVKRVVLPPVMHTRNTLTSQIPLGNQAPTVLEIPIHGAQTAQQFIKDLNRWLAENPFITDCRINLTLKTSLISPFVARKFFVRTATVTYRIANQPNPRRYAAAFLYKLRPFGSVGYDNARLTEEWKDNNPECQILSTYGGHTQRVGKLGIFAQYYDYVFFTK